MAFLISVNNKSDFSGWFDNSEKGEVSGHIELMGGSSCGCTPPKECCRLPPFLQVNIVVASVDGHMADDQVRTSSKVARGTPKWRSS